MRDSYDVVVVGGGAAGLAGAVALARFRRGVLVVDAGSPRNAPAGHIHNFLGRDGIPPAELLAAGRAELAGYGGEVVAGNVASVHADGALGFRVILDGGGTVAARRVLFAAGVVDELPDVPGVAERWGRQVLHCPYCHGWEVRDQPIGVLASSPMAIHQARLFSQLSDDVVLFEHTASLGVEETRGIRCMPGKVVGLSTVDDGSVGVRLSGGEVVARAAVVVQPFLRARAEALAPLGLLPVPVEMGGHTVGTHIESGAGGATAVPGLYVAGNVTDIQAQLVTSAAAGLAAGAAINADLL